MKEELTTEMHAEFTGDEINSLDLRIEAAFGAISRGAEVDAALNRYELTKQEYIVFTWHKSAIGGVLSLCIS